MENIAQIPAQTTQIPIYNKNGDFVDFLILDTDFAIGLKAKPYLKNGYVQVTIDGISHMIHRLVMGATNGDNTKVSHLNGNNLDNRKANLRYCTPGQIIRNRQKRKGTSSKYIGVTKRNGASGVRWLAQIRQGDKIFRKVFMDEESAAYYYDTQITKLLKTDTFTPRINGVERPDDYKELKSRVKSNTLPKGICFARHGRYKAQISLNGKSVWLGDYDDLAMAESAYKAAKQQKQHLKVLGKLGTEILRNEEGIAIILTNDGHKILVDDDKYFFLKQYTWYANSKGHFQTHVGSKIMKMNKMVFGATSGSKISHINGIKSDLRLANLRISSNSELVHKNITMRDHSSKYLGVHKHYGKFTADITKDGKKYHLGQFDIEEEASKVRDIAAIQLFGNCANLNNKELLRTGDFSEYAHIIDKIAQRTQMV